jgi:hypothetical protein
VTVVEEGPEPLVRLDRWTGPFADDDPDHNFKTELAAYAHADPLQTLRNLAANIDVPVGAVVRYVLAKWATGGSEALLELGPSTVQRMRRVVADAEAAGTDPDRLAAYERLRAMLDWVGHGLDDPTGTYPTGGGAPPAEATGHRGA